MAGEEVLHNRVLQDNNPITRRDPPSMKQMNGRDTLLHHPPLIHEERGVIPKPPSTSVVLWWLEKAANGEEESHENGEGAKMVDGRKRKTEGTASRATNF
ncbi:uncharacterized protein G2W53_028967 [Senna tora]|uniref:Uncharacterized protein n=1 Tax=Senna tora TaxID=362788 RepID=A0A834WBB4_9FABA|nr:uncharacterized protein G2W53_028967 [Senna tora]